MKYTKKDQMFIAGKAFSNCYPFKIRCNPVKDRLTCILELVKDRTVLHVGCCDHIPLIKDKIIRNEWLQGLLDENCKDVIGCDINEKAVEYVNDHRLTKRKVYHADLTTKEGFAALPKVKYDYILLGEILEHVDNPVLFLGTLNTIMRSIEGFQDTRFIITVPNAFCFQRLEYMKGMEYINSDHRYWFTPYTIGKVMNDSGIVPLEYIFANYSVAGGRLSVLYKNALLKKLLLDRKSYRADTLVVIGK